VRLLLAFVLIPFLEMYILIRIGQELGAVTAFALVIGTAIAGATLTRLEGWRTMRRIQAAMAEGLMPAEEMIDGVLIFAAGLVLITPGFLTDAVGFLLLVPPTRRAVKTWIWRRFQAMADRGDLRVIVSQPRDDIQDW
jgi:UPF0716 protein FxsA